jgi:nitroimidazol reductase NimA-like FMN-containing flavoprotein (pyridoxamine 5'-phosphate oxidase superfamily)
MSPPSRWLAPDPPVVGVRELSRDECLHRLGRASFGRVGATSGALPTILPVNYRLVHDRVVFRTSPGTKLALAAAGAVVAFEVDEVDPLSHAGWSVLVIGRGRLVVDPAEQAALDAEGVPRWASGPEERYVTVSTTTVTGREIGIPR